jgi:hypothetical protein
MSHLKDTIEKSSENSGFFKRGIPATPGPKIPDFGSEPEFRPEF